MVRTAALGFLLVVAVVIAVVARGGESTPSAAQRVTSATPKVRPTARSLVGPRTAPAVGYGKIADCKPVNRRRARPAGLPAAFPLPRGTVITDVTTPKVVGGASVLYIWGHVPLSLDAAASFLARELQRAGFALTTADAEPGEAEARFRGNGRRGGWKVNQILRCPGRALLLVGVSLQ